MQLEKFIENFAGQFEETDAKEFKAETVFSELEEWSSFTSLSIIAMVDEEYNVKIKGAEIRSCKTIGEIYAIVTARS